MKDLVTALLFLAIASSASTAASLEPLDAQPSLSRKSRPQLATLIAFRQQIDMMIGELENDNALQEINGAVGTEDESQNIDLMQLGLGSALGCINSVSDIIQLATSIADDCTAVGDFRALVRSSDDPGVNVCDHEELSNCRSSAVGLLSNTMDAITMCLDFFGLRDAEDTEEGEESEDTEESEDSGTPNSDEDEDGEDGDEYEGPLPDVLEYIVFFTELLTCPGSGTTPTDNLAGASVSGAATLQLGLSATLIVSSAAVAFSSHL